MFIISVFLIVETILLAILVLRKKKVHFDGRIVLTETETKKLFSLEVDGDPDAWARKTYIVLEMVENPDI